LLWQVGAADGDLLATDELVFGPSAERPQFSVSRVFLDLAEHVITHSDTARFALLYRLLWRLRQNPNLLADAVDPDVHLARAMEKAIRRDIHKMHAFVRFKEVVTEDQDPAFVAWFEPDHYIVEAAAPFFVRRFTGMRWSILTPYKSALWDGVALHFGPGADKRLVPDEDRLEAYWRTYYASIFNPARLKTEAMQKEMPKKYWKNLPEATLIGELIRNAGARTDAMVAMEPTPPSRLALAIERQRMSGSAVAERDIDGHPGGGETPTEEAVPQSLEAARHAAARCTRCDLYGPATQVVFGVGPATAKIMFVGEQPGDKEDLAGLPFVGPAGAVLDRALREASIDRSEAYVTNAVKHFKYEPRGKFRLHKKPDSKEIAACRYWLDLEKSLLDPTIIVALGASAAQALLGRTVRIGAERGKPIITQGTVPIFITVHPSYLLRLPDEDTKAKEYARFVEDLNQVRVAARL
jgi:DNA polymerase